MIFNFIERLRTLDEALHTGYAGRKADLLSLIHDVRQAMLAEFGIVPTWEAEELSTAENFANADWLLAGLCCVAKALAVSQLSDDEYWGGYSYTKPDVVRVPRRVSDSQ